LVRFITNQTLKRTAEHDLEDLTLDPEMVCGQETNPTPPTSESWFPLPPDGGGGVTAVPHPL